MKKLTFLLLVFTISLTKSSFSQQIEKADSLGLPGDNLNLVAVLDLFQKSETFEVFEKKLNSEDSKVNNLDLNNDGKIDYIKVIDHQTGESHAVVLQVPINEKETQDVAVIEIDKDKTGKILVQIVGDEELYGKDYIVEPTENDPTAKTETPVSGNEKTVINNTTNNYYNNGSGNSPETYVVVHQWPIIHYVYAPAYVVYVSPWYWYSYPTWWSSWSPWYWHNYYWHHYEHHHYGHYGYYHRTNYYRAPVAHGYYGPRKSTSVTVKQNRTANVYHKTYTSKNRAGDGKIKPGTSNPGFKNKPENKVSPADNRQKPNNQINKPASKPNRNPPAGKIENKPSHNANKPAPRSGNKPAIKPSNKPVQKQGGSKPEKKSGGGKGR